MDQFCFEDEHMGASSCEGPKVASGQKEAGGSELPSAAKHGHSVERQRDEAKAVEIFELVALHEGCKADGQEAGHMWELSICGEG
jgi:hypothetical protein